MESCEAKDTDTIWLSKEMGRKEIEEKGIGEKKNRRYIKKKNRRYIKKGCIV